MKRREFMNGLATLLGGTALSMTLTSCGGSSGGGGQSGVGAPPSPNGYRFTRLLQSGNTLPGGRTAGLFMGGASWAGRDQVVFFAQDTNGRNGLYGLAYDASSSSPSVLSQRVVVQEGDVLPDGATVMRIEVASANRQGAVALRLMVANGLTHVYLAVPGQPVQRVITYGTPTPDGSGLFGSHFGDLELQDDGSLLVVGRYFTGNGVRAREGLFRVTAFGNPLAGDRLLRSGDLLPDSTALLGRIGLIDASSTSGQFVAQTFAELPRVGAGSNSTGGGQASTTSVVTGAYGGTLTTLHASSRDLIVPRQRAAVVEGQVFHGPRTAAATARHAVTVGGLRGPQQLYHDGVLVARSGQATAHAHVISTFSGATMAPDGTLFVSVDCQGGLQELLHVRASPSSLLATGDRVDGVEMAAFGFGLLRDCVDENLRLVFAGRDTTGATSLILGLPV